MDPLVPTERCPASDIHAGDIIVERPRPGQLPYKGRMMVRAVSRNQAGTVTFDIGFPSTICHVGCEFDPRRCQHYGHGGAMFLTVDENEEEVVVRQPESKV